MEPGAGAGSRRARAHAGRITEVAAPPPIVQPESAVAPAAAAPEPRPVESAEEPAPAIPAAASYAPAEPSIEPTTIADAPASPTRRPPRSVALVRAGRAPRAGAGRGADRDRLEQRQRDPRAGHARRERRPDPHSGDRPQRRGVSRALELQRAVQNIPEVRKVQALQFERGVLILAVEHAGATDLAEAIAHLPLGAELISAADGRLELTVGTR